MWYAWVTDRRRAWLALGCALLLAVAVPATAAERPRLVLLIVVDQLRGDMPWRPGLRLSEGGFAYFQRHGLVYRNAHYRHATTLTATGHATLATGADPARHGIVGNVWYDTDAGRPVYCVEDAGAPLLGAGGGAGASPRNLLVSTIGDELVRAGRGSRVFSVSVKDRGAILTGGHLGKAFWYSRERGGFVTSAYYYRHPPAWLERWSGPAAAERYRGATWSLLLDADRYPGADDDDSPHERPAQAFGGTFPHVLPDRSGAALFASLPYTPLADELTLEFVRDLVVRERVGQSAHTDLLAVSFSATDYIGHTWGPDSLEAADNLLRLDRTLAALLAFIDATVGLDQTLVVLSSDHGMAPIPERLQAQGLPAGRHDPGHFIDGINRALQRRWPNAQGLVAAYHHPGIYLDRRALQRADLLPGLVEDAVAGLIMSMPGTALALTRTRLLAGEVSAAGVSGRLQRSFHPRRSGDVLVAAAPGWHLNEHARLAAVHGSPNAYDTHVPVLFAGRHIGRGSVYRPVAPEDVAPTLALYLDLPLPSAAESGVLVEVLQSAR